MAQRGSQGRRALLNDGRAFQSQLRSEAPAFVPNHQTAPPGFEANPSPAPPGFAPLTESIPPGFRSSDQAVQGFQSPQRKRSHPQNEYERSNPGRGRGRSAQRGRYRRNEGRHPQASNVASVNEDVNTVSVPQRGGRRISWNKEYNQGSAQTGQTSQKPSSNPGNDTNQPNEDEELATCAVCYEDLEIVSIGKCNHKDICGFCCLRMRKQKDYHSCPLCKADLFQVVLAQFRNGLPNWDQWSKRLPELWNKRSWSQNIFIDDQHYPGTPQRTQRVSAELQAMTGNLCPLCDKASLREFPSVRALLRHLTTQHDKTMCPVCLMHSDRFPVEMEVFTQQELLEHVKTHMRCSFCPQRLFFDIEHLMEHVRTTHHLCLCCIAFGREIVFRSTQEYWMHLVAHHYACQHPDCRDTLTAYPTQELLNQHKLDVHPRVSGHPSMLHARAIAQRAEVRRMARDGDVLQTAISQGMSLTQALQVMRQRREASTADIARRLQNATENVRQILRQTSLDPQDQGNGPAYQQRGNEEGLRMIDDDYGMTGEAFPTERPRNETGQNFGGGQDELLDLISTQLAESNAASSHFTEQEMSHGLEVSQLAQANVPREAFPALPGSTDANPSQGPIVFGQSAPPQRSALPPLVSVTRRCPCGRRVDHPVVPQGNEPPPLLCDSTCEATQRRAQLANAFGIADPDSHVAVADRSRIVTHSPELLAYAREHKNWVEDVEALMASFVRSRDMRSDLPAMPKTQRKIVHEMAPAFGLTSQSYGQEPTRHLRLFKGSNPGVPSNLLSREAANMTAEQINAALSENTAFVLHLYDIDPSADLSRMFSLWGSDCAIEGPDRNREARVTFVSESALKDAANNLGGGIRGKFRINRSLTPQLR